MEIKQVDIFEIEDFHGGENIDFFFWVMTPYNYTDDYLSCTLSHHMETVKGKIFCVSIMTAYGGLEYSSTHS